MKGSFVICCLLLGITGYSFGQAERKHVRQGNDLYAREKFEKSEAKYYEALEEKHDFAEGIFNLGDALYEQEKYEDAARQFEMAANMKVSEEMKGQAYHNLGNTLLKSQKLPESIEAYKEALRHNPNDLETKHNLMHAMRLQQQQEQQQQQDQEQNEENEEENEEENQDQQQNEEQENQEEQAQQEQQQEQQEQEQQQSQPREAQMSKEEAERLLEALKHEEQKVQEKLQKKKIKAEKRNVEKDW